MKIGAIKKCEVAVELHAAAAGFDGFGSQAAQFIRERFLETAGARCKEFQ